MTNFITKPALTLKALFAVAVMATAVVAMPSGPDFTLGVSPAYAKKIKPVTEAKLKAMCERVGGEWYSNSKTGVYYCKTRRTEVACYRYLSGGIVCWGGARVSIVTTPNKTGKATGPKTTTAIRR